MQIFSAPLVAFDPGETTGVAWLVPSRTTKVTFTRRRLDLPAELVRTRVVKGHLAIWHVLNELNPCEVVSESFRLYAHAARFKINSGFPEIEMIGVIRLWTLLHDIPMHEQSAAHAKTAVDDAQLRRLQLYDGNKHNRDALRHLILRLRRLNR